MRTTGKPGYTFWSFCDNIIIGCLLEERTFEFVEVKKIHVKPNKIKFGTKKTYYLCAFRLEFEKTVVIFEISTLRVFKFQSFMQFGIKHTLFMCFE